jgi:hypothetical protein
MLVAEVVALLQCFFCIAGAIEKQHMIHHVWHADFGNAVIPRFKIGSVSFNLGSSPIKAAGPIEIDLSPFVNSSIFEIRLDNLKKIHELVSQFWNFKYIK